MEARAVGDLITIATMHSEFQRNNHTLTTRNKITGTNVRKHVILVLKAGPL